MSNQDHTAAIFAALGITPETQPWAYSCAECDKDIRYYIICSRCREKKVKPISLLSGTLEADGLAVRLVEIARDKQLIANPQFCEVRNLWIVHPYSTLDKQPTQYNSNYAHAVHDALVEALGITKEATP